jgi:hypothetical protein
MINVLFLASFCCPLAKKRNAIQLMQNILVRKVHQSCQILRKLFFSFYFLKKIKNSKFRQHVPAGCQNMAGFL